MSTSDLKKEAIKKKKKNYHVHGNKGVYCGGDWIPIEECADWICPKQCTNKPKQTSLNDENTMYDVAIIGAGCVGASIARELSKYLLKTILLERDDDVTQGATKGNSGIIHCGYDDAIGSVKAKHCWNGNQMFPLLDKELKFGYLKNGSLVIARSKDDIAHLHKLYERGQKNGCKNLKIIQKEELHQMEPYLGDDCIAALYSPDAGTVTPYEYTIALAENAAMNGVQIRTRHEVIGIDHITNKESNYFDIKIKEWPYSATSFSDNVIIDNAARRIFHESASLIQMNEFKIFIPTIVSMIAVFIMFDDEELEIAKYCSLCLMGIVCVYLLISILTKVNGPIQDKSKFFWQTQSNESNCINYDQLSVNKVIKAKYVINCGGLFADKIANMIGDYSFKIKPRLGEYLLLHKEQGHLAGCTLFPCPDTKIGTKGVLVQTTLWGNLILGPTARDTYKPQTQRDSADDIMKYLLKKSRELVPSIDASKVIHSFAGARAKSDRGDWIIERTKSGGEGINFFNVAGIDSPGLAGSPSIALFVVNELLAKEGGLKLIVDDSYNCNRRPTILPKNGWKGLKLRKCPMNMDTFEVSENESDLKRNVVCKCEKVTEYEILDAMSREGVSVDTTQALRRRTRAGMGHCQADAKNCNCELYVAYLIAKKKEKNLFRVGRRPWPATSLLNKRWLDDKDKEHLKSLTN